MNLSEKAVNCTNYTDSTVIHMSMNFQILRSVPGAVIYFLIKTLPMHTAYMKVNTSWYDQSVNQVLVRKDSGCHHRCSRLCSLHQVALATAHMFDSLIYTLEAWYKVALYKTDTVKGSKRC